MLSTIGDCLFSKDTTNLQFIMISIQDDSQQTNGVYIFILFFNQAFFIIIMCHFHLCPFLIEVIRKGKNKTIKKHEKLI